MIWEAVIIAAGLLFGLAAGGEQIGNGLKAIAKAIEKRGF